IPFAEMQHLKRFAHLWDVVVNRGNWLRTAPLIWQSEDVFGGFSAFCDVAVSKLGQAHGIAMDRMTAVLFSYLVDELKVDEDTVRAALQEDYVRGNRKLPVSFRPYKSLARKARAKRRQQQHAAAAAAAEVE
ncbi:MAG: hypothetical protein GWP91_14420, partial [Rhodobacterales bacterium]|nr:hypothetical protein [Rhodobacterales bacterium]